MDQARAPPAPAARRPVVGTPGGVAHRGAIVTGERSDSPKIGGPADATASPRRRKDDVVTRQLLVFAGLLAAALLAYGRAFDNGFWGDNFNALVHAAWVWTEPSELWRVWLGGNFRFFSQALCALAYILFGFSPGRYISLLLILHVLNGYLLSRIAQRLSGNRWKGAVAGLLFTVGLGHYGSALFTLTEITGIASATFTLLAIRSLGGHGTTKSCVMAAAFLVLAVFSKETAAAALLFLGLLACSRTADRKRQWFAITIMGLLLVMLGALAVHTWGENKGIGVLVKSPGELLRKAPASLVGYVALLVFPLREGSGVAKETLSSSLLATLDMIRPAIGVAALLASAVVFVRGSRTARLALAWIVLTLCPYQVIQAKTLTLRYLYLPSVGYCVLVSEALWWLFRRNYRWKAAFVIVLALWSVIASNVMEARVAKLSEMPENQSLFEEMVARIRDGPPPR